MRLQMSSYSEGFCAAEWMVKVKNGFIDEEQCGQKKCVLRMGQPAYWAVKDASYGMRGYVIGPISGCTGECLLVSFKGEEYRVKLSSISTRRPKRGQKGDQALAEAPKGCDAGVEPQLHGHATGSTVHFAAKKRQRLGPRKGKLIFGAKGIVIGQSTAFTEPSLLAMFNREIYHVRKSAVPTTRPNHGRQAAPPPSARPDMLSDADECHKQIENPSLKVFDTDDLPRAAAKTRRPAASHAFPEITLPARLFFAALVYATRGPIGARQRVQRPDHDTGPAKYVVHAFFHFIAVKVFEDGYGVIDDDERCQFDGPISFLEEFFGAGAIWYRVVDIEDVSEQAAVTDAESDSDRRSSPRSTDIGPLAGRRAFGAYLQRLYNAEEASRHSGDTDLNDEPFGALPRDDDFENMADRLRVVKAVMRLPNVRADLLFHDDACHFEQRGKLIFGMKDIVIGQSAAFAEPSLLVMFNGEIYHVRKSAAPTTRPNRGRQAAPPPGARPDVLSDADECREKVENPSLKVFDTDDLPRAAAQTRRPAASYTFPEITLPARLFFAALVYAICGPIGVRKGPFTNVFLQKTLQNPGYKVAINEDGPRWALRNGNRFLSPFGKARQRVQRPGHDTGPAKYVVHIFFRVIPAKVFEDGCDVIDDDERCQFDGPISFLEELFGAGAIWYRVVDIEDVSDQAAVADAESDSDRRSLPRSVDIDPLVGRRAFGAHLQRLYNAEGENMADKLRVVKAVMGLPNVRADLPFHDDACPFEQHVQKNHAAFFRSATYFLI
ncbi:unnamed protein product, partial [Prorocentrum cordatum]